MRKETFDVQGMTCSSCQAHVEKAVRNLDGIKSANVNLISNNMIVEYDEKKLDENKIISAVVNAGYGANKAEDNSDINSKIKNEEIINSMKRRLIISICFWIPLMYVAMHHMFYEWFGIPVPSFIKSFFHGNENAIKFAFTQLILLLQIILLLVLKDC